MVFSRRWNSKNVFDGQRGSIVDDKVERFYGALMNVEILEFVLEFVLIWKIIHVRKSKKIYFIIN